MINKLRKLFSVPLYSFFLSYSSLFKISFIWGSNAMFFSFTNVLAPLTGVFYGVKLTFIAFLIRNILGVLLFNIPLTIGILYHIPTLFASLYLSKTNWFTGVAIPFICILLFITNPIGNSAYIYSLFWLIPIFIFFMNKNNKFLHFLAATFVAHAVGSIIWLYSSNLSPEQWLGLIPFVFLERLAFAVGMLVFYKLYQIILVKISDWDKRRAFCRN